VIIEQNFRAVKALIFLTHALTC